MTLPVGINAFNLIVSEEDVSEAWYGANASHPVWPGGSSGATWGIGYDGGQQTAETIMADWEGTLGTVVASRLQTAAGVSGAPAAAITRALRDITIPWPVAIAVFTSSTLPRYAGQTEDALPNCDLLHPDAFGALVSIGYNRGNAGWNKTDDHHREMFAIRRSMQAKSFATIPSSILAMQRLWPKGSGLWNRRAKESLLFKKAQTP